jgi:hypothetical protein
MFIGVLLVVGRRDPTRVRDPRLGRNGRLRVAPQEFLPSRRSAAQGGRLGAGWRRRVHRQPRPHRGVGSHISGSNCDLGKLRVLGQQKLRLVSAGGIPNWIVGYNDPNRKNPNDLHGVVGQRVKIKEGSKTLSAKK